MGIPALGAPLWGLGAPFLWRRNPIADNCGVLPPNLSYLGPQRGPSSAAQKAILGDQAVTMWLQGLRYTVWALDTWQLRLLMLSLSSATVEHTL